jgi:hypothetical protein
LVIALLGLLGVLLLYLRGRRAGAPDHDGDIDGSSPAATPPSN